MSTLTLCEESLETSICFEVAIWVLSILVQLFLFLLTLSLIISLLWKLNEFLWAKLCGCDVLLILPECFTAQRLIKYFDRMKTESGSNFDEYKLLDVVFCCELFLMLIENLIASKPNFTIEIIKRKNVIDEWFGLRMIFWSVEHLQKHLFHQLQMWGCVEPFVEWNERTTELQAITGELEFISTVHIKYLELNRWAIWCLGAPHEQVISFSLFEKQEVIARSVHGNMVYVKFGFFALDFGLFFSVGNQVHNVLHKLFIETFDASGANNQSSLSIFPFFGVRFGIFECSEFIFRIIIFFLFFLFTFICLFFFFIIFIYQIFIIC